VSADFALPTVGQNESGERSFGEPTGVRGDWRHALLPLSLLPMRPSPESGPTSWGRAGVRWSPLFAIRLSRH